MRVLAEGQAEYLTVDPDGFRAYVRDHKQRALTPKLMSARDAVERYVADGDYLVFDCNYFQRGPSTLIREVIRQQKRDLWLCGKFTYVDVGLLVGAGCVSKIDCGFFWPGATIDNAVARRPRAGVRVQQHRHDAAPAGGRDGPAVPARALVRRHRRLRALRREARRGSVHRQADHASCPRSTPMSP